MIGFYNKLKAGFECLAYSDSWDLKIVQYSETATCSGEKDVLKNYPSFTGKQPCLSLFLIKLQGWGLQLH